jgi:hypothetical protein
VKFPLTFQYWVTKIGSWARGGSGKIDSFVDMQEAFQEIREQIHEIRNIVGPVHLKMADLEMRIVEMKHSWEESAFKLESKVIGALFRLDQQDAKIAAILERIARVENRHYGQ